MEGALHLRGWDGNEIPCRGRMVVSGWEWMCVMGRMV